MSTEPSQLPPLPEHSAFTFADVDYPYPVAYFPHGGSQVAYIDQGTGPPVVFIHGQGADLSSFAPVYPALAGHFRIIALDLPGFGKSDKPEPQISAEFYSDLIRTMIGELKLERPWLVGHSFGGLVALIYAEAFPADIAGMTLIDSAGFYDYPLPAQLIFQQVFSVDAILNTPVAAARDNYYRTAFRQVNPLVDAFINTRMKLAEHRTVEHLNYARTMTANIELLFAKHFLHDPPRFEFPIHLIHGRQDQLVPLAGAITAESFFPSAHLDIVEDCGHFPLLEHSERFNTLLKDFLMMHLKGITV